MLPGDDPPSEGTTGRQPGTKATPAAAEDQRQVVVYYFHGERRCKTCLTIEAYAQETVDTRFAKQLASGEVVWKVVDYDGEGNGHFVEDFGLVSASLVIVETSNGETVRFEVLQKAWSLVRDKAGFQHYVRDRFSAISADPVWVNTRWPLPRPSGWES